MTSKSSTGSGNWSTDSLWNPAGVPLDGDAVTIVAGHVVTFDVDQSAWVTGLTLLSLQGTLRFKTDANTCLKMADWIDGYGTLYVGNSTSDRIGSSYTAKIHFVTSHGILLQPDKINIYGAVKNHKGQLAQAANAGTATLVFTTDVGLAVDDRIIIMTCTAGMNAEDKIVQSYDPETKTAVLTTNLASNHYIDDYVAILTRNVRLYSPTGNQQIRWGTGGHIEYAWFTGHIYGAIERGGVYVKGCVLSDPGAMNGYGHGNQDWIDCVFIGKSGQSNVCWGVNRRFTNCLFAIGSYGALSAETHDTIKDCVIFNHGEGGLRSCSGMKVHNTKFLYNTAGGVQWERNLEATDCYFKGNTYGHIFRCYSGVLRNPSFADGDGFYGGDEGERRECDVVWIHDYNQTPGDHRARMKGGWVKSESSVVHWGPKSLKLEPVSTTYRAFSHFLKAPFKNGVQRKISFWVRKTTSMAGWLPRVYLCKPGSSPIDFVDLSPLATFTMPNDNNDVWVEVTGTYTHTADEVLELIAVAKNGSGYVYFADPVVM